MRFSAHSRAVMLPVDSMREAVASSITPPERQRSINRAVVLSTLASRSAK